MKPFLVSNSFPFSLIRRRVVVEPRTIEELKNALSSQKWISTWGHSNTVGVVSAISGVDLRPETERPAISLSDQNLPSLGRITFEECWLISPHYAAGFRPQIHQEVSEDKILDWQVLLLDWSQSGTHDLLSSNFPISSLS